MLKLPAASLSELEKQYPGIQAQIEAMEGTPSSPCPRCGREDAERITIGLMGRTNRDDCRHDPLLPPAQWHR